jgi:ribosomal protein L11 methyltransferase
MTDLSWLEVSLTVDGELAEAVADVLARFAPSGVVTEQGVRFAHPEDEGTPDGAVSVRAYLPADEKLEETRRKLEEALYYLGMIRPLPVPTFTPVADQNWMDAWKKNYQPIPIGEKLIIVPAWLESPDESRIPVRIDPGMAFGTGTHPTTQLCMELIEQYYADRGPWTVDHDSANVHRPSSTVSGPPSTVIDIGCGSGILSIAALKLGADLALGVDIDPASVTASRENARANSVPDERFPVGLGSVAEVLRGDFPLRQAPLVLANILAPIIVRLLDGGLADLVAPGGTIILSGILREQAVSVQQAAEGRGLKLAERRLLGDWMGMSFGRLPDSGG